ncbi:MAG: hypothetical protein HQL67_00535 [Magnetococcales bacterium]|nr:hypothetical protein [Magnetococcales bacterium]
MNLKKMRVNLWYLGAFVWGGMSLVLLDAHFRVSGGSQWEEMWFLCSLFWFQFGFGRVFVSLMKRRFFQIKDQLLMALIPPVLLYILIAPSIFKKN